MTPSELYCARSTYGIPRTSLARTLGIHEVTLWRRETGRVQTGRLQLAEWEQILSLEIEALVSEEAAKPAVSDVPGNS